MSFLEAVIILVLYEVQYKEKRENEIFTQENTLNFFLLLSVHVSLHFFIFFNRMNNFSIKKLPHMVAKTIAP
jgi:hypothetical protein